MASKTNKSSCKDTTDENDFDVFEADTLRWERRVIYYKQSLSLKLGTPAVWNIMDMKAVFCGFAAALKSDQVWVMNVVPARRLSSLAVLFDRGFVGVYHDWCEPFSTYSRTYDFIHGSGIEFSHKFSGSDKEQVQPSRPDGGNASSFTSRRNGCGEGSHRVIDRVSSVARAVRWSVNGHENEPETQARDNSRCDEELHSEHLLYHLVLLYFIHEW